MYSVQCIICEDAIPLICSDGSLVCILLLVIRSFQKVNARKRPLQYCDHLSIQFVYSVIISLLHILSIYCLTKLHVIHVIGIRQLFIDKHVSVL